MFSVENGEEGEEADDTSLDNNKNKIVTSPDDSCHDDDLGSLGEGQQGQGQTELKAVTMTADKKGDAAAAAAAYISPEEKVAAILRGVYLLSIII